MLYGTRLKHLLAVAKILTLCCHLKKDTKSVSEALWCGQTGSIDNVQIIGQSNCVLRLCTQLV